MCGIVGILNFNRQKKSHIKKHIEVMNRLIAHRGPDGEGVWLHDNEYVAFGHRRLAIIGLDEFSAQPMRGADKNTVTYNGEIYNYIELKEELKNDWQFKSSADTETILAGYHKWQEDVLSHLTGMFAFALWDEKRQKLFCARDRFGIKPFYYTIQDRVFYFASEAKALLAFLPAINIDKDAFAEYVTFQYTIGDQTLFEDIKQLMPGHSLSIENGNINIKRYWNVEYNIDHSLSSEQVEERLNGLLQDSIKLHLRSDVEIGAYVSGGVDSSLVALLANQQNKNVQQYFNGRFTEYSGYDESHYAKMASDKTEGTLWVGDFSVQDFQDNIENIIYHLDFPVAGPGSFPQYMVSKIASQHVKTVLGGQGGDEIFGGYARYLLAYFEQCIKASLDGTSDNGNFDVSLESLIPNLGLLREYKPMIREFWREGLFDDNASRYFRLINRANDMKDEVEWGDLNMQNVFNSYQEIFSAPNVGKEAYFNKMTHFDLKCLLPALLQVEDRVSMAHGLEARVPLLDHSLVEFIATIPANIKFKNGQMKYLLKSTYKNIIPNEILTRRDKMGFPVPLKEWFQGPLKEMLYDNFNDLKTRHRPYLNTDAILTNLGKEEKFSRKTWGLLSLELWYQQFHDKAQEYRNMIK